MKLQLPQVTLVAIADVNVDLTIRALQESMRHADFAEVLLLTPGPIGVPPGITQIACPAFSKGEAEYSPWVFRNLGAFIKTPHALTVEYDGYVLDPAAWDGGFLQYDYIGSVWPWFRDGHNVGNSGFCLRSKALLDACATIAIPTETGYMCDTMTCRTMRAELEKLGFKFAPEEVARQFSFEREAPQGPTFGFHGLWNMYHLHTHEEVRDVVNRLDTYVVGNRAFVDLMMLYYAGNARNIFAAFYKRLRETKTEPEIIDLLTGHSQDATALGKFLKNGDELIQSIVALPKEINDGHKFYEQGVQFKNMEQLSRAHECFVEAIRCNPANHSYHLNLAFVSKQLHRQNDWLEEQAMKEAVAAARIKPDEVGCWVGLAEIALECNKFPEAIAAFNRACQLKEPKATWLTLRGFAHDKVGDHDRARRDYEAALALDPEQGTSHFLLGGYFMHREFNPEKQAFHSERAFTCKNPCKLPVEARWNAALAYLQLGDYKKGWDYFDARLESWLLNSSMLHDPGRFTSPMWDGERNMIVRVHAEMGFGDVFLMARFLPIFCERFGVQVVFECQPQLIELMTASFIGLPIRCIPHGDRETPYDRHLPMMSLPRALHLKSYRIPFSGAYIKPPVGHPFPPEVPLGKKWRVGYVYAGGARAYNAANSEVDARRSLSFDQLQPILAVPDVDFISLMAEGPHKNPDLRSFTDTAALIASLDLVISVDTAVANLAGAMGIPVWVLSRYDGCWRWSPKLKTPWFPSAKVYRQDRPGDWSAAIASVESDLRKFSDTMASGAAA